VKKTHGKGGRKEPVAHDEDLWHHTAATIEPLKRGKPRVHPSDRTLPDTPKSKALPKPEKPQHSPLAKEPVIEPGPTAIKTAARKAPDLSTFDRSSARKIRIGRIDIEARVDLHGLRQSEAHAELRAFLFRCQSRGLRYVLVITGKGKAANASERSYSGEGERGILKRNVPRWLEEPDVRSIVVSYTTAAIHHGGEGAIYVHLRSKIRT
jgi:DNA-nicking Smr family endonuclease